MSLKRKNIHPVLVSIIPIVKTIAEMFGKNCEVVLHDLGRPQNSVIAIENGYITGRKIGDPITDFALSSWSQGGFRNTREDKVINYKTKTKDGRILKSSSVFIKDEKENIVGCFCVNYDMTGYLMFDKTMKEFCTFTELNGEKEETFINDVDEILDNIINKAIEETNKPVSLMQKKDNLRVVKSVEKKGGFMVKGSVDQLALKLNVSRFTIYNYLDEIKIRNKLKK